MRIVHYFIIYTFEWFMNEQTVLSRCTVHFSDKKWLTCKTYNGGKMLLTMHGKCIKVLINAYLWSSLTKLKFFMTLLKTSFNVSQYIKGITIVQALPHAHSDTSD